MKTRRKRTLAREIAIQLLYQYEIRRAIDGASSDDVDVDAFVEAAIRDPETRAFCRDLYDGVIESLDHLDALIGEIVDRWKVERLAAIDRAILRLATYELKELDDVPPKVVINEAIELAKKFSTTQSSSFVNGILDRLLVLRPGTEAANESRPDEDALWKFPGDEGER